MQRIVLATEETTVTQQVGHRPIKCQSRLWSQRGTKVKRSHHGDSPLLRPTGIQFTTKTYATLQAMAPTSNVKLVNQPPYSISRATSIDSCLGTSGSSIRSSYDGDKSSQWLQIHRVYPIKHPLLRVVLTKNTCSFVCFEKEQVESTAAAYVSLFVGSFCDADKPCAG